VSRVFIRYALPRDADRLVSDGVVSGPTSSGEPWTQRVQKWLAEQQAGRRLILVAEGANGLLGTVQLVFKFPAGYADPEAANGVDIAMIDSLRTRPDAPPGVATQLITDVQNIARKRAVHTLTFLVAMGDNRGIAQAKSWGFEEFRIMPEPGRMLAFFRKSID
jgi:lysophospholipase L1-like esterase